MHPGTSHRIARGAACAVGLTLLLLAGPALGAEVVKIRVGDHATYTRVVFELDSPAGYRIEKRKGDQGNELVVTLEASSATRRFTRKAQMVSALSVDGSGERAVARIRLRKTPSRVKEMILANPPRIVFDLVLPEDEIAAKQKKSSRAAAAPKPKPAPAKPVAKAEPKPAPPKPVVKAEPTPVAKAEPKPAAAKPVAKAEPKPAPAKPEPKPAPIVKAEPVPVKPAPQADTAKAAVARTTRSSERKSAAPQATPEKAALPFPIPESVKAEVDSEIPIPPPGTARPDPAAEPPAEEPELAAARPTPEPEAKPAEPRPEAAPAPKPRPAAKPVARTAPSEATAQSLDFVLWGGAAAGVLFLLVVIVLLVRRRKLPNDSEVTAVAEEDGEGPIPAGGFSMDASAESVGPLFEDVPTEDVPTGGAAAERPISQERARTVEMDIAAGPGLFDEPEKESDKMDLEGQDLPQDSESPTQIGVGAAGGGDIATLVRDLERRMAQLEARLDESTEARERLERQVAAQAEELRVQRAAIARTQRALRSLNRPAEEQATEPALRDQS